MQYKLFDFPESDWQVGLIWDDERSYECYYAFAHKKHDGKKCKVESIPDDPCPWLRYYTSSYDHWEDALQYIGWKWADRKNELFQIKNIRTFKNRFDALLKEIHREFENSHCNFCNSDIEEAPVFHTATYKIMCEDCHSDNLFSCNYCGNMWGKRKMVEIGGVLYCPLCAQRVKTCPRCNHRVMSLIIVNQIDGTTVNWCGSCCSYASMCCNECGTRYVVPPNFTASDRINFRCPSCMSQKRILNYSTDVLRYTKPMGDEPILYGVELEVEVEYQYGVPIQKEVEFALDTLGQDFAILKRDGTINNGFEIVTTPATIPIHKEKWEKFFTEVGNTKIKSASNCGMHVHVTRAPLKKLQIAKAVVFLNDQRNKDFITTVAGRYSCGGGFPDHTKNLKSMPKGKYEMLNLTSRKPTVEYRIFASTIQKLRFFSNLEFSQALLRYTREHPLRSMNEREFIEFIQDRKEWPNLYDLLVLKGRVIDDKRFRYLTGKLKINNYTI